jgi:hypothetical protein
MIRQPEYQKECRSIRALMRDWIEEEREEEFETPLSAMLELLIKQRKRPQCGGVIKKNGTPPTRRMPRLLWMQDQTLGIERASGANSPILGRTAIG